MERLTINRDDKGQMKRVYLEHSVLTPDPLLQLQQRLVKKVSFRPAPVDDLHLTLFHYGKPDDLYAEIGHVNHDMAFDSFMDKFQRVLEHNAQLKSNEISVKCSSLDLFGDATKPVLVVRLEKPAELLSLRSEVLLRFHQFLKDCGIFDVNGFMGSSPNLKFQTDANYNPHLSVGFPENAIQPPQLDLTGMAILLGSPQLANVKEVKE